MSEADGRRTVRVGSRRSQLALLQTHLVISGLKTHHPHLDFAIVTMDTIGDKILDQALSKIGEKSLFTRELETALLEHQVDMIVHSLKDLPTSLPDSLTVACVLERESPLDAVILHSKYRSAGKTSLADLPKGSVIGSSSVRRVSQLKRAFPGLKFDNVRGNLNTRYRKLEESGSYDALILAEAGLRRMDWGERLSCTLPEDTCMYAVGQGALAVECRTDDAATRGVLDCLMHRDSFYRTSAERALLKELEGGCSVPVAVSSNIADGKMSLSARILSLDGQVCLEEAETISLDEETDGDSSPSAKKQRLDCDWSDAFVSMRLCAPTPAESRLVSMAVKLGQSVAGRLIAAGAEPILAAAKLANEKNPAVVINKPTDSSSGSISPDLTQQQQHS